MQPSVRRIIEQVAAEKGIDSGFLVRLIEIEEEKEHLLRRHGIFDEIKELSRRAAQRVNTERGGSAQ